MINQILDILQEKIDYYEEKLNEEDSVNGIHYLTNEINFFKKLKEALTPLDGVQDADN
jgi:hypothetical protein